MVEENTVRETMQNNNAENCSCGSAVSDGSGKGEVVCALESLAIQNANIVGANSANSDASLVCEHTGYYEIQGNKIKVFIKKAMRKLLRIFLGWYIIPIHERQTKYNAQTNAAIDNLTTVCEEQRKMLCELNSQVQDMQEGLKQQEETITEGIADNDKRISALNGIILKDNVEIRRIAQQVEKLGDFGVKSGAQPGSGSVLTGEQNKYLDYILSKLNISYDPAVIEDRVIDYFKFENTFRGSEEEIKERQKQYVPYLKTDYPDGCVLELGFGRGEILDLMRENGIACVGVDCYPPFVKHCTEKGHNVVEGDALTYLLNCEDESLNGIVLAQVAEHVNRDYLFQLIRTGYKKLRAGCSFIIETPNPETLITFAAFFIDGTHSKPVPFLALRFMFEENGYSDIIRLENAYSNHPYADEMQRALIDNCCDEKQKDFFTKMKKLMFGAQDLTVIARK